MNNYNIMPGDVLHFSNERRPRIKRRHWSYTVTRCTDKLIFFKYPGDERESKMPWPQFEISYRDSCDYVTRNGQKLTVFISDEPAQKLPAQ